MRSLSWAIGTAWLAALMAASLQVNPASADTIQDYLVQQVCVDANDTPTAADPITCPGTARKLRIGEHLPYHKWDMPTQSPLAQISDSYPIADLYGRTRVVSGPNPVAVQRCGVGTDSGVAHFGNTTYYLVDCHDWTFIFPAENGGWDPAQFHIDPLYNSVNLLKNTHMQCTDGNGRARSCGTTGNTCRVMPPWERLGDLNWTFNQNPQAPRQSSNCSLLFSIPTSPAGQSVYQDTQGALPAGTKFSYGVALRAPLSTGGTHPAKVAVHQIDASGTVLSTHSVNVGAQKRYRIFKGDFTRNPAAVRFRFEIYVGSINTEHEMTEAWIAPIP